MSMRRFRPAGSTTGEELEIDTSALTDLKDLKEAIGREFGVVQPQGLSLHHSDEAVIESLDALTDTTEVVLVKLDGHSFRDVPGPNTLPIVGNYFEVFPDHLGNNQRLFDKFGPIFHTNNYGSLTCQTNDPKLAEIVFTESEFFSKEIVPSHPLYPIKNPPAGVFLGDTHAPAWKVVHKFLPPAFGPKAVRHYAPIMNSCINEAFPVLDELEKSNEAWNVYQYMLKVSSGTVGKIVLARDFNHFKAVDSPLDPMVLAMAELLAINKKISSRGSWYGHLPFGDPVKIRSLQKQLNEIVIDSIKKAKSDNFEDLPLQDAALKASSVIDYLVRATDNSGAHLPEDNLVAAVLVAAGAGFTTTSSLLSWLIYCITTYPDVQARLLQELVDHGITDTTELSAAQIEQLVELDRFVKETQRRHNPSYQPGRTAQRDLVLPGGHRVQKGTVIIPAIHHIHNNTKVWDRPYDYDMDRWNENTLKNKPKAAYVPFAMGQRMCIGFNFALLEVKIFMCKLVYRYHWEKEGDITVEYDPWFQLIRPNNLYVKTTRRTAWPSQSEGSAG